MKKRNSLNRHHSPVLLFAMLFLAFVDSSKAQSTSDESTVGQNRTKPKTVVRRPGEPAALFYDYGKARFLVDSADTQGAWSLVELTEQPGYKTPLHRHDTWDESFYVLEGTLTAKVADSVYTLPTGSYILIPRGTPHGQANVGSVPVKLLLTIRPSGFERHLKDRVELFKTVKPDNPEFPKRMDALRKKNAQYIHFRNLGLPYKMKRNVQEL